MDIEHRDKGSRQGTCGQVEPDPAAAYGNSLGVQTFEGLTEKVIQVGWDQLRWFQHVKIERHSCFEACVPMHKPVRNLGQANVKMVADTLEAATK